MTFITPEQARAYADAATRSTSDFIRDFDDCIDANSRQGERRIVVTLPRGLAHEGQQTEVIQHYQQRGFVAEQLSVTGRGWNLQISW
ncbi:hypothetical protein SSKA14_2268 [Stenotrophomonas sp. SKA14]|uniref:hypothetical protein n=1 Tax=Stenotrophomonas TaxID=40323 RepID=UPI00018FEDCC|nr:hypothetical protein [Stenotrophomonas sp. SKA14]EED39251.1 hypothetical protein SSKA14_2268 [Stenotrophomonas sp. SKA14]